MTRQGSRTGKDEIHVPESGQPRIVIVGGGFAGLNLLKKLKGLPVQVVLIDRNNYHQFTPLLYQVATSGIEPDSIAFPFRKLFEHYPNVLFRMGDATGLDPGDNRLDTSIGPIHYDTLVLAHGSATSYFGNEGLRDSGNGLKSVPDALGIRNNLLRNLEKATVTPDPEEKVALCNIAIVGGGPTGVEMAGALAEFRKYILPKDYPDLDNVASKIYLIEGNDRLLNAMPESLSDKTLKYLRNMDVEVILGRRVQSGDGRKLTLDDGSTLNSANFLWTAGVMGMQIEGMPGDVVNKQGRISVDEFGRVAGLTNVFVIGDLAVVKSAAYPSGHPMVAQAAIQQGKALAGNLKKLMKNQPMVPFRYKDKGSLVTIGRKKAVAQIRTRQFGGFFAWVIWTFVHLFGIAGIRNKLMVALDWIWNYLTYDKGDRVII